MNKDMLRAIVEDSLWLRLPGLRQVPIGSQLDLIRLKSRSRDSLGCHVIVVTTTDLMGSRPLDPMDLRSIAVVERTFSEWPLRLLHE